MLKLKNLLKNEKVQSVIILIGLFYIISSFLLIVLFWDASVLKEIVPYWIILAPLPFLVFTPTIAVLYCLLYRKKSNSNIAKFIKLAITAFSIPFTNLFYMYIEHFMTCDRPFDTMLLGAVWLFLILPTILIVSIVIPKRFCKLKKEFIILAILMEVFGWGLIATIPLTNEIVWKIIPQNQTSFWNPILLHQLNKFEPAIKHIYDYKEKHGKYPNDILNIKINSDEFTRYSYIVYNNNQDFVLNVAKYEFSDIPAYRYCSSEKLEHCKAIGRDGYVVQYKIGNWIYYNYDID